jgi:hypothetical protein
MLHVCPFLLPHEGGSLLDGNPVASLQFGCGTVFLNEVTRALWSPTSRWLYDHVADEEKSVAIARHRA